MVTSVVQFELDARRLGDALNTDVMLLLEVHQVNRAAMHWLRLWVAPDAWNQSRSRRVNVPECRSR